MQSCVGQENPQLVGDPVDTLTGTVFERKLEFRLVGPLEFWWERFYDSSKHLRRFGFGWGHTHSLDHALELDESGISYQEPVGNISKFPHLLREGDEASGRGLVIRRCAGTRYQIYRRGAPVMEFEFRRGEPVAPLTRLSDVQHQIQVVHDEARRLCGIIDSVGRSIEVLTAADGSVISLTLEGGHAQPAILLVRYTYDEHGNLVQTSNAQGHGYTFKYDAEHRMLERTGRKGFTFRYTYDSKGRCIRSMGDDLLYGVALSFDVPGRRTRVIRPDRGVWFYTFDSKGGLASIQDPLGGVQKFVRDSNGRVALELDQNQNAARILYDSAGAPIAKIGALGHRSAAADDPNAPDPRERRIAANAAEYHYGRLLNVTQIRLPTQAEALEIHSSPPVRSLVTTRIDAASTPRPTLYAVRPLAARWWPEPKQGWIFNTFGKLVMQVDYRGNTRHWNYDPSGNVCEYRDFDGGCWTYDTGKWHFVHGITNPLGAQIRFTYTTAGEIGSCVDAGGTATEYEHDLNDRVICVRRHGTVRETYERDAAGNLLAKYGSDMRELLRFEIGPGNLPIRRRLASGDEHVFRYDEAGRPVAALTKKDAVELAYDDRGQQISDRRNGKGTDIACDGAAGILQTTVLERFVTLRERLDAATLRLQDPGGASHLVKIGVHGLVERTCSNGSVETSQFDVLGRCLFKRLDRPAANAWTRRYHWSGESELRLVEDDANGDVHHEYDAAHRLRRRVLSGAVEDYSMDSAGNLLQQPHLQGVSLIEGNRLQGANGEQFSYNARNHIESRVGSNGYVRYVYDSRDMLVRIESTAGVFEAEYDALGRRTRKRWQDRTTEFFWNGEQLVAELRPDGGLRLYVYADPLALSPMLLLDYANSTADCADCKRYFIFADQIGSPRLIQDEAADTVWSAQVSPFGLTNITHGAQLEYNLRFPGHYFDAEVGLHCNGRRYYDPLLGRYLQSDPWGLAGGYNLYSYRDNPLHAVDVRGLGEEGQDRPCRPADDEESKPLHERIGWVDSYGEQKKVTGDGSADRDHQPSKLAIKKAIKEDIAQRVAAGEMDEPTPAQMKEINDRIDKEATSVVVDHEVHKRGPTHGNKNKEQSEIDKHDLGAAAARDADAMVENTAVHDPDNLPATQAAADKIKEQTHESIMEKNRAIVDDVMNPPEE